MIDDVFLRGEPVELEGVALRSGWLWRIGIENVESLYINPKLRE
jgi:hypothetical protein